MGMPVDYSPALYLDTQTNSLMLTHGVRNQSARAVTPKWDGKTLQIGCTSVTREALGFILGIIDGEDTIRREHQRRLGAKK